LIDDARELALDGAEKDERNDWAGETPIAEACAAAVDADVVVVALKVVEVEDARE
jgi:hypothetical protein